MTSLVSRSGTLATLATLATIALASLLLASPLIACGPPAAPPADLARAFPAGTVLFLRGEDAAEPLRVAAAALRERFIASEGWRAFLASPKGDEFRKGLLFLTAATGRDPLAIAEAILGGESAFGLVPAAEAGREPSPLIVIRPADPAFARSLLETLSRFAKEPRSTFEHGGVTATVIGDGAYFWDGDTLVAGNERALLEATLERLRGGRGEDDLARAPRYRAAMGNGPGEPLRLFVDLAAIRSASGGSIPALDAPPADAIGSIILGGYQQLLRGAETISISLRAEGRTIRIRGEAAPPPAEAIHPCYRPAGARPIVPTPAGAIASFQLGRDLGGWWESRLALVGKDAHAALAKFSTDIGNAFGGRDFGEEVLSLAGDTVQLFVLPPPLAVAGVALPEPLLPGFALAVPLAGESARTAPFQVLFQTLVTFVNFDRMQRDLPPWLFGGEEFEGTAITTAQPPSATMAGAGPPGIEANFRPSIAVRDGFLYLGTEPTALRALLGAGIATPEEGSLANGSLEVRAAPLAAVLAANRKALVANSVLEGKSVAEAEVEVAGLISLVELFDRLVVAVWAGESGALSLEVSIDLAPPLAPAPPAAPAPASGPPERF